MDVNATPQASTPGPSDDDDDDTFKPTPTPSNGVNVLVNGKADVPATEWYYDTAQIAHEYGLISGLARQTCRFSVR